MSIYPVTVAGHALSQDQDQGGIGSIGRHMTDDEILAWCGRRWMEQATAGPSEKYDHEERWENFLSRVSLR